MSPVSKKRKKKASPKSSNRVRAAAPAYPSLSALESVQRELEGALRWTLRSGDPFDAEILISELLGSMRGVDDGNPGVPDHTVDAFVDRLAARENAASVAALVALSRLAPGEESRARARRRIEESVALGLSLPRWTEAIDGWAPRRAEVFTDDFADDVIFSVEFAGAGRRHMLLADLNFMHLGGWCTALSFIDGAKDVETMRSGMADSAAKSPGTRVVELDLAAARFLLERALAATARTHQPELDESFDDSHALALARLRLLPASTEGTASPAVRAALTAAGLHTPSALDARSVIAQGKRDAVVQKFLVSSPAAALVGIELGAIKLLARSIVDYGCDLDDGRPLRVSPAKLAGFLLRWLPRRLVLDPADKAAVPDVVGAWADFAAGESHLAPTAVATLKEALAKVLADFDAEYDNPANFGPARALVHGIGDVGSMAELEGIVAGRVAEHNASLSEGPPGTTYRLRVDLEGATPPIWRRLELPASTTLKQLHRVLQVAFDWDGDHLHAFTVGRARYGVPDGTFIRKTDDEALVTVGQLLARKGSRLDYMYDFGDSWSHRVVVEQIDTTGSRAVAVCTGGRRASPFQDCGGIHAYAELCEVLADPTHPDHADRAEWAGFQGDASRFDPEAFDRDALNVALARFPLG